MAALVEVGNLAHELGYWKLVLEYWPAGWGNPLVFRGDVGEQPVTSLEGGTGAAIMYLLAAGPRNV